MGAKHRDDDDENIDETSAFYLKHQNRALAVELRSRKHYIQQLEKEREERRRDCFEASQALSSLYSTWASLEAAVLGRNEPMQDAETTSSSLPPPSTSPTAKIPDEDDGGEADDIWRQQREQVEWTRSLSRALSALGRVPDYQASLNTGKGDDVDPSDLLGVDTNWSAKCATNVAARATALQEHLLLFFKGRSATVSAANPPEDTAKRLEEALAKCRLLETALAELRLSRDAALQSERKVRRNVYRLSAGMISEKQLVQAIEDNEKDLEIKQQIEEQAVLGNSRASAQDPSAGLQAAVKSEASAAVPAAGVGGSGTNADSSTATDAQVQALRARIADLEKSVSNRESSLQEVRSFACHLLFSTCARVAGVLNFVVPVISLRCSLPMNWCPKRNESQN